MKRYTTFAAYQFIAGAGFLVFGGTNILFQAESIDVSTIPELFKIFTWIGASLIILSLLIFGIVATLSGQDK